jgi:lipoprotein-anchoring transpeptidase ErfK/SrfK
MQQGGHARRPVMGRRARMVAVAAAAVSLLTLAACTSSSSTPGEPQISVAAGSTTTVLSNPPDSSPPNDPAVITAFRGHDVSPVAPIKVSIANGKLTDVTMVNAEGKHVRGTLADDGSTWQNSEVLGYSKTYRITATGVGDDGSPITKRSRLTTLTPNNMTMPYFQRIGGYTLGRGEEYGVGIVPVVHFDEPIPDRARAERVLQVTTTPHIDGSWYWSDDQNVHFRPKTYWPSGTKVQITAKVYGVNLGQGLYGQSDVSSSFTIGRKQVTVAYDTAPKSVNKVRVYNAAGRVIRTMNTSMGEHTGEEVNGQWINFYTLDGTYTVLAHEQPANMCSDSYGLPANAPGGYACEAIYNATKISIDGIYLHELTSTIWDQDHGYDVSHGCLNLNTPNSLWYFNHSMIGDPVEIHGAKGAPTLEVWQGGDWTVPWKKWLAGSAL